jgi:type I restriction enzyme S subunit
MKSRIVELAKIANITTGKLDSNAATPFGDYPFFTCAQQTLRIDIPAYDTEAVLLGGNNAAGVFPLKYFKGQFNAYQRTYIIETLDAKMLDTHYLYYALIPSLSFFHLPLPDIGLQHRIASILSSYDDLIEANRRRIELLEESARLLYKEWFVDLRFPGHEQAKIVDGLPEGWARGVLSDLCCEVKDIVSPLEMSPDTPYIGLEHMPRRSISLSTWGHASDVTSIKHRFAEGDIIFGKIRPYFHKVGIAFIDGVASSDAIVLRPYDIAMLSYVLSIVSSDHFVQTTSQGMKEGSKMPRADWKQMQRYPVLLPKHSLVEMFNSMVLRILGQLKILSQQNDRLAQARDLLLPKLMSGEIEV